MDMKGSPKNRTDVIAERLSNYLVVSDKSYQTDLNVKKICQFIELRALNSTMFV